MLSLLALLTVILLGYAVAVLAASAFLHLLWLGAAGWTGTDLPLVAGSLAVAIPVVALFVSYFAFIPAALAIGVAEIAGWRDWLAYAVAGAAVAAVLAGTALLGFAIPFEAGDATGAAQPAMRETTLPLSSIPAGMVGGIAYWLVAGRNAGTWRRHRPEA